MFSDFAKKAIKQDSRNRFEPYSGDLSFVPDVLYVFYKNNNPVDVEVKLEETYVRFIPAEELEKIQKVYALGKKCFIFASCNDEPIYLKDNKVYTCLFGKKGIIEEMLSENLQDYLAKIAL